MGGKLTFVIRASVLFFTRRFPPCSIVIKPTEAQNNQYLHQYDFNNAIDALEREDAAREAERHGISVDEVLAEREKERVRVAR